MFLPEGVSAHIKKCLGFIIKQTCIQISPLSHTAYVDEIKAHLHVSPDTSVT